MEFFRGMIQGTVMEQLWIQFQHVVQVLVRYQVVIFMLLSLNNRERDRVVLGNISANDVGLKCGTFFFLIIVADM